MALSFFLLQLLAIILPILFGKNIEGIFQCLLLWSMLKFGWLLVLLKRAFWKEKSKPAPLVFKFSNLLNFQLQKKISWLLLPLSLHMLLGGGMEYIDGFIVTSHFEEKSAFAVFRYGARELPLVTILSSALAATLIPLSIENQSLAIQKMKQEVSKLSQWLYPLTFILIFISPYLFPLVYNADFVESARVFNIYLLLISSRLLLPQVIIYSKQHNFVLVASAVIEISVNLGLSLLLVKKYGLEGIAFATVLAYLVNKLILIAYNYFQFGISLSHYLNIKNYLFYNAVLVGVYVLTY